MKAQAFFELLKAGLWEREITNLSCFPLSRESWIELLRMARKQTVSGLIYRGLQYLPMDYLPPNDLRIKLMVDVSHIEKRNIQQNAVIDEIQKHLSAFGVAPILQKGRGVSSLYEYPLFRDCGDIDFYFASNDFVKAKKVMEKFASLTISADGSLVYGYKTECVEHHNRLIDCLSPLHQGYIGTLIQTYGYKEQTLENGCSVMIPNGILNLLLLNAHIMKHVMGWGIGLRQLCDMARAYHSYAGTIDYNELLSIYRKLGMTRWNNLLHSFLVQYLGLDSDCLPAGKTNANPMPLYRIVMSGGDFGFANRKSTGSESDLKRKYKTMCSFFKKSSFALKYAPSESFFSVMTLLKGQFV